MTEELKQSIEHRNRERKVAAEPKDQEEKQRVSKTPKDRENEETVQRRRARDCTRIEAAAIKREGGQIFRGLPTQTARASLRPVKETAKKSIPNGLRSNHHGVGRGEKLGWKKRQKYWNNGLIKAYTSRIALKEYFPSLCK
ncbi:hypothetical protein M9H77_11173 [Catharanthus roseus]|uniref:Uncharacterized protein n=1 Tax=Catharanthus roseus TaxID=4058 RepID=A0ACC0BDW2_CATRO|nr:hypothetical protein M9H77_11173 [Catharanthus roseus]